VEDRYESAGLKGPVEVLKLKKIPLKNVHDIPHGSLKLIFRRERASDLTESRQRLGLYRSKDNDKAV
jgi:hypothetical protein